MQKDGKSDTDAFSAPSQDKVMSSPKPTSLRGKHENGRSSKDRAGSEGGKAQNALGAPQEGNHNKGDPSKNGDSMKNLHQGKYSTPLPYQPGNQRTHVLSDSANYWHLSEKPRVIGVGTVGLFENQQNDKALPPGASACINGTVLVGPPEYVRKMKGYEDWREKHSHLFSTLKVQDAKDRDIARRRQLRTKEKQREEEQLEYASAVKRLRQRGWSILGNAPRHADNARFQQQKAEREAFLAECEENVSRKIQTASKQREKISQQLATYKEEKARQEDLVRNAARLEREMHNTWREEHSALIKEQAATTRAEREAEREFFRDCAVKEDTYRREHLNALRERVFAKTHTDGFASTFSSEGRGNGREYSPGDWRSTFKSPLRKLPSASDENFRKQWMSELQEERKALARAEVARVKQWMASNQKEIAYRGNCERADALRQESEMLRERKQHLDEEVERFHKALREQEIEGQKRRENALRALRESRRLQAARLRRAIEEEELLAQTAEGEGLRRLRERAAEIKKRLSPTPRVIAPTPLGNEESLDD